mmetsp:Transcript_533/g.899  ORF Transcript_533/g.899 Transcript_533/m.899 type:complete len:302 (-) Transcript_533:110-1015(-)
MDNPKVDIEELFASAEESFDQYKKKQQHLMNKKLIHPMKGSHHATSDKADDSNPSRGKADDGKVESDNKMKETQPISLSAKYNFDSTEMLSSSLQISPRREQHSKNNESQSTAHYEETLKRNAYNALNVYLHGTSSEATTAKKKRHLKPNGGIASSEMRRREAVAASLKARSKLCSVKTKNVKPLLWGKPLFRYHSNSDTDASSSSSSSIKMSGKRNAPSSSSSSSSDVIIETTSQTIVNYQGLETIMPRRGISVDSSSSSSIFSNSHYSYYKRKWTKEEVRGLVEFADKWFTTDMKCRKR